MQRSPHDTPSFDSYFSSRCFLSFNLPPTPARPLFGIFCDAKAAAHKPSNSVSVYILPTSEKTNSYRTVYSVYYPSVCSLMVRPMTTDEPYLYFCTIHWFGDTYTTHSPILESRPHTHTLAHTSTKEVDKKKIRKLKRHAFFYYG